MKRQILYISFPLLLIFACKLNAQPSASLYFTTAFPVGEFRDYVGNTGFGASSEIFFFSPSENVPYGIGLNFSFVSYGMYFGVDPYTDELGLSYNKANNFASVHLLFQLAPAKGSIRPYVETLFGGSYIFSHTDFIVDYCCPPVTMWFDDWAWSYGAGLGLKFLSFGDAFLNHGSLYVDLKVRYLLSTSTEYLDRSSVVLYYDTLEYSTFESKTDMITASIGVYFYF
jgi:hypothetical protein